MLEKLKNMFYLFFYSMKGGEELSTSNKSDSGTKSSIIQKISQKRLSKALLKGELTKEVVDLRYRDYRVSEESKKYKYVGNGVAVKVRETNEFNGKIKFTISNKLVCESVLEAMDNLDESKVNGYTLKVKYKDFPRFRLERYCTHFNVDISNRYNYFTLYFNTQANANDITSKQFVNELKRVQTENPSSELMSNVEQVKFVTFNNDIEKDYVEYTLTNLVIDNWGTKDGLYYLCFKVDYNRNDLTEKFESKELKEKYEKKEAKEVRSEINEESAWKAFDGFTKHYKCENCGKEVKDYIGDSSLESTGKILCQNCWLNLLSE